MAPARWRLRGWFGLQGHVEVLGLGQPRGASRWPLWGSARRLVFVSGRWEFSCSQLPKPDER